MLVYEKIPLLCAKRRWLLAHVCENHHPHVVSNILMLDNWQYRVGTSNGDYKDLSRKIKIWNSMRVSLWILFGSCSRVRIRINLIDGHTSWCDGSSMGCIIIVYLVICGVVVNGWFGCDSHQLNGYWCFFFVSWTNHLLNWCIYIYWLIGIVILV